MNKFDLVVKYLSHARDLEILREDIEYFFSEHEVENITLLAA